MYNTEQKPSEQFVDHMNEIVALRHDYPDLEAAFKDMWDAFMDEKGAVGDRMLHPENADFLDEKIKKRHNKLQRLYIELDKLYVGLGGPSLQVSPDNIYRFMQSFEGEKIQKLVDISVDSNEIRREVAQEMLNRITELEDQGLTKQEVLDRIIKELSTKIQE